jgi:hypothetical protein
METVWEKVKKGLKDGATLSVETIEEYTKIGKLKLDEVAARRKIVRSFAVLGEEVFELMEKSKGSQIASNAAVKKAVRSIKVLREELEGIEGKIDQVQADAQKVRATRAARSAGTASRD